MLEGQIRESISKSDNKALRKDGYLLANIYGAETKNISAKFVKNDFVRFMRNKQDLSFKVKVADQELLVMVQEYQKDPVSDEIIHVDLRVLSGKVARFLVPVQPQGTPVGIKNKGVLLINKKRLKVKCKPEDLPNYIVIDVSQLDVGDSKMIRDIDFGDKVKCLEESRVSVLSLVKAK